MARTTPSLWTEDDQHALAELVHKRGFADVALGLRNIAHKRAAVSAGLADKSGWLQVAGTLTRIYDAITEGRALD